MRADAAGRFFGHGGRLVLSRGHGGYPPPCPAGGAAYEAASPPAGRGGAWSTARFAPACRCPRRLRRGPCPGAPRGGIRRTPPPVRSPERRRMMARVNGRGGRIAASAGGAVPYTARRPAHPQPPPRRGPVDPARRTRSARSPRAAWYAGRARRPLISTPPWAGEAGRPRPADLFRRAAGEGGAARPTAQPDRPRASPSACRRPRAGCVPCRFACEYIPRSIADS